MAEKSKIDFKALEAATRKVLGDQPAKKSKPDSPKPQQA